MIRALILLLLPVWALADISESPQQILESVAQAARQQNYQGTIVMASSSHWQTMEVKHAMINGEEYERLKQLTGASQESIKRGAEHVCSHAEHLPLHRPLKNPLRIPTPKLDQNFAYDFTYGDLQRMAGRMVQPLNVKPYDNKRYGLTLWIDKKSKLLLGVDLLDSKQNVLERTHYVDISLAAELTPQDFIPNMPAHGVQRSITEPEKSIAQVGWKPYWLPVGFELTHALEEDGSVRLMYFDGITAFSVFIDRSDNAPALEQQWGATAAVVIPVAYNESIHRVTAVGEVPLSTLREIVASVKPNLVANTQE